MRGIVPIVKSLLDAGAKTDDIEGKISILYIAVTWRERAAIANVGHP